MAAPQLELPEPPSRPPLPSLPATAARPRSWRAVRTPRWIASGARRIGVGFLVLALLLALVPWQQNAVGAGRVIAYVPAARQQEVAAPVKGRVEEWFVREGETVEKGDPLVALVDNDPDYLQRLRSQRDLLDVQLATAAAKVTANEAKLTAAGAGLTAARQAGEAKVEAARQKVLSAAQKVEGAEAGADVAARQAERAENLAADGLRSTQSVEDYALKRDATRAKLDGARADLAAARADLAAAQRGQEKIVTEAESKVAEAQGDLEVARSTEAEYRRKALEIDSKLARQNAQVVPSPVAGVVARILQGEGTAQVKEGEQLAVVVPDTASRAVEIWLDGNDISLVRPGQEVRLQFEGWPALQFGGWPSVAVGTFAGTVDFVDGIDDGAGHFRAVVLPHADGSDPWPAPQWLRQGLRAKGWVMLAQVPVGYEIWRQLNNFPPAVGPPTEGSGKGGSGGKPDLKVGDPVEGPKAGKAWRKP